MLKKHLIKLINPIIMNKNVFLHELDPFDIKRVAKLIYDSYDFLAPYVNSIKETERNQEKILALSRKLYLLGKDKSNYIFAVKLRKKGLSRLNFLKRSPIIGLLRVSDYNKEENEIELGGFGAKEYSGKGYAGEALNLIEGWLYKTKGIKNFRAEIKLANIACIKMVIKNGYIFQYTSNGYDIYKKTLT